MTSCIFSPGAAEGSSYTKEEAEHRQTLRMMYLAHRYVAMTCNTHKHSYVPYSYVHILLHTHTNRFPGLDSNYYFHFYFIYYIFYIITYPCKLPQKLTEIRQNIINRKSTVTGKTKLTAHFTGINPTLEAIFKWWHCSISKLLRKLGFWKEISGKQWPLFKYLNGGKHLHFLIPL